MTEESVKRMERRWRCYKKYCARINKLYHDKYSLILDGMWIDHRAQYWCNRILTGKDDIYGRVLLRMVRANRGLDVVMPEELK